jgi:hypothetical protein
MSQTTVLLDDLSYRYSPDDNARGPLALWTVAAGRAVDELTGAPPETRVWLRVTAPGLSPQVGPDGLIGLVTQPSPRFPRVFAPGYSVTITLGAPRYLPREIAIPIARALTSAVAAGALVLAVNPRPGMQVGQRWVLGDPAAVHEIVTVAALGPGLSQITLAAPLVNAYALAAALLPGPLTSIALGDVELHRMPVTIRGRVMGWVPTANAFQPVAGATVQVPFTWRRQADVTIEAAKDPMHLVAMEPGLYRERLAVTDALQPVTETAVAADGKSLLADLLPGDSALRVSNALGMAVGTLLRIQPEQPDTVETVAVTSVVPSGVPVEPAGAGLAHPVRAAHRHGATVEHVTAANVLTAKALQRGGLAGDPVVFLANLAWGGTPALGRLGGGAPAEYQRVRLFATTTDAEGYFALPPISRVAKVRLAVTPPALPPQNIDLQPDYQSAEQWLDVSFS